MPEHPRKRFVLQAAPGRAIPAGGLPASQVSEWGGAVRSDHVTFILHPPVDFELAYRVDRHVLFLAFSSAATDMAIGEGQLRRARVRAGSAIFVEPDTCVRVRQREPVEFLVLSVDPAHVRAVGERAAAGRPWHTRTVVDVADPGVAAVAAEIRRSLLADPLPEPTYLQALADAILSRFVCRFLGEAEKADGGEALAPAVLARVVRHIDAHIGESLRAEDLAALAGLSRSHFSRAFQRVTGDPPRRFVLKRRLCRARDLISGSAESLAQIAARTGFASQAHLSTVFRKELGTTPGHYRDAFRDMRGAGAAAPPAAG